MLIDAVVEKGQVRFLQPVKFAHDHFSVKVDIPDREVVLQDDSIQVAMIEDTTLSVVSKYPAEYLAFKALQDSVFGKEYKYLPEKTDKEIMQEHWTEKYAQIIFVGH